MGGWCKTRQHLFKISHVRERGRSHQEKQSASVRSPWSYICWQIKLEFPRRGWDTTYIVLYFRLFSKTWLTERSHLQDKWTKLKQEILLAKESAMYWSEKLGSWVRIGYLHKLYSDWKPGKGRAERHLIDEPATLLGMAFVIDTVVGHQAPRLIAHLDEHNSQRQR